MGFKAYLAHKKTQTQSYCQSYPYNGVGNGFQSSLDKFILKEHNYMKIFLVLLLFATQATAETWKTKNAGHGEIVLTDNAVALSIVETHTLFGTWSRVADYVVVKWQDNDVRSYPVALFTKSGEPK